MKQILTFVCVDAIPRSRIWFCIGLRSWNHLQLYLVLLGHGVVRHRDCFLCQRFTEVILGGSICSIRSFWVLIMEKLLSVVLTHIILILHIFDQTSCPLFSTRCGLNEPGTSVWKIQEILQNWVVVILDLWFTHNLFIRLSILKGSKLFVNISTRYWELIILVNLLPLIEVYTTSLFNSDFEFVWAVLIILDHIVLFVII